MGRHTGRFTLYTKDAKTINKRYGDVQAEEYGEGGGGRRCSGCAQPWRTGADISCHVDLDALKSATDVPRMPLQIYYLHYLLCSKTFTADLISIVT